MGAVMIAVISHVQTWALEVTQTPAFSKNVVR